MGASLSDARLVELIGDIQDELPGYGYRRVTRELQRRGYLVNHKRIARVMKSHGLGIKPRRRFVRTTDSDHDLPIFPNLYRNVIPAKPDLVWVADFTYIRIATGFCFLAAVLDACSRKVVGYAISRRIDTQLALAALNAAVQSRQPPRGCIHHTDRGCQYASDAYRRALKEFGLRGSMSSPGNPYHNAQAESFMKTLKVEEVYLAGYETFAPRLGLGTRNMRRIGCETLADQLTMDRRVACQCRVNRFEQHVAAPSPSTMPVRFLENGLQDSLGAATSLLASVCIASNAFIEPSASGASEPPATARSTIPLTTRCQASPIATPEDEQAVA
jgi:putative transposase